MQRVKIGDAFSDWLEVKRGEPQASVPRLMFILLLLFFYLYADDGQHCAKAC